MASHTGALGVDIMVVVDAMRADADEGREGDDDVDGPAGDANGSSEDGLGWPELCCCCCLFLLVISISISHKEPVNRWNTVDRKGNSTLAGHIV
jgi:hypothetical protein